MLPKSKPLPAKSKPAGKSKELGNADTSAQTVPSGRNYSKEEVKALIISYSNRYGIDPQTPLCIAYYESGYNANAKNRSSSAGGAFQYLESTFRATDEGKAGHSRFEAEANVKAAIKYMASRGNTKPWVVNKKCPPVKYL